MFIKYQFLRVYCHPRLAEECKRGSIFNMCSYTLLAATLVNDRNTYVKILCFLL